MPTRVVPAPPANARAAVPPALRALVRRCLQPLATRLADAAALAEELEALALDDALADRRVSSASGESTTPFGSGDVRVRAPGGDRQSRPELRPGPRPSPPGAGDGLTAEGERDRTGHTGITELFATRPGGRAFAGRRSGLAGAAAVLAYEAPGRTDRRGYGGARRHR